MTDLHRKLVALERRLARYHEAARLASNHRKCHVRVPAQAREAAYATALIYVRKILEEQ